MILTFVLTVVAILIAVGVVVHTLIRMKDLPTIRDHRPLAPVVALGVVYILLKLQTVFGVPEIAPGLREAAWLFWEGVTLFTMGFLVHLHTQCRNRCAL